MSLTSIKASIRKRSRIATIVIAGTLLSATASLAVTASPASASVGQNPANCGSSTTWKDESFNVAGNTVLLELRHSYPCEAGWARLSLTHSVTPITVRLSAWNPGQPSQDGVPGTNYTYTVDATPGNQVCGGFQAWRIDAFGQSHYVGWFSGGCYSTGTPAPTYTETVGGPTHTWTDYSDAGGTEGAIIPTGQSVQVTCVVQGFRVTDGNTNWYRIASSPWDNAYYASADAFYNNGAVSGSLDGTPYVDPQVPAC
jgi:hypothetical protein